MVMEENKELHSSIAYNVTTEPTYTTFALVFIHSDEGPVLSQRLNPRKTMYLLYQAPEGKAEKGETARQAAVRELYEETGLVAKPRRLKFIAYDGEFDCNLYAYKLPAHEYPEHTEPDKMSAWLEYLWESFTILYEHRRLTPSLHTFFTEFRSLHLD